MFNLEEVLVGVQDASTRQDLAVPDGIRDIRFNGAAIDSRLVGVGDLFVALQGERSDGHRFLADVMERRATGALVRRDAVKDHTLGPRARVITPDGGGLDQATSDHFLLIAVDDPQQALQRLAAYHRSLFSPTVIGITGSVGKTSTKEVVASVLARKYRTLKNPRSYNSEATMPLVLLQLEAQHEVAVLEMGIYGPGDLTLLTSLAHPLIGIVTNIGPSHMERMGSLEAVAAAKSELVQALPATGHAILNYDDERVRAMASQTAATPFFYGLDPAADVWADEIESQGLKGIAFSAHHAGETVRLRLPLIGRHSVHTALAAIAAGLILGLGWDAIIDGLRDEDAQLRLLAVPGINGATLIDDTYNASPISSMAALNLLSELDGRKIAVLGDMLELGATEEMAHRTVGRRVAEIADALVVVGRRAVWIAEEAQQSGMAANAITVCDTNEAVTHHLQQRLAAGDHVLIKGSRGAAMEQIVAALQRQPEAV